jgi:hypothetical protein
LGRRTSTRWAFVAALAALTAFVVTPAATPTSYTIVAGGSSVAVTVPSSGGTSTASFSGTAGQRVSLNITSVTIFSSKVSILKPNGNNLLTPFTVTRSGYFLDVQTLPTTGTYKIVVDPKDTYTGKMTLRLYDVPADPNGPVTADGTAATVTTTTPGQNARLTFAGTTGQRISVNLTGVTYSAARLRILEPDGVTNLYSPALSFGPGGGFLDTKTLPANGLYTLLIDPKLIATGSATVQLYTVASDATGTVTPGGGAATATTTSPGQNAILTFAGTAGQRVSLLLGNSTYPSVRVSLRDPGNADLYTPPASLVGADAFMDTVTLPANGTYTVFVDPQGADTGSLDVTVFDVPADLSGSITPGTPLTVSTATPGQNALYDFSGTSGQRVSLNLTNVTYASAKVSITKLDGTVLVTRTVSAAGDFVDPIQLPATATYKVKVDPQNAATGALDVTLSVVPNDVTGALTPGVAKTVTISAPGQNAKLTYAGMSGQRISLNITNVSVASAKVKITKPDGTSLQSSTSFGTSGKFIDVKSLTATGTYKVEIDPQLAAVGNLDVTLYVVPADATGTMTSGTAKVVTTAAPGQNATLTFSGTANQRMFLKISNFSLTGVASPSAKIKVLKPDGFTLEQTFFPVTGDDYFDTKVLPLTGTYKIFVDPQDAAFGSLTLTYYIVPPDLTGVLGSSAGLTFATPGQKAAYTFAGTSGQSVTIGVSAGGTVSLVHVALKGPTGTTLDTGVWDDTAGGSFTVNPLPANGTYTVEVDPEGAAFGSLTLTKS